MTVKECVGEAFEIKNLVLGRLSLKGRQRLKLERVCQQHTAAWEYQFGRCWPQGGSQPNRKVAITWGEDETDNVEGNKGVYEENQIAHNQQ